MTWKNHPTVEVKHPKGWAIGIDKEIAPLITAMWAAGLRTSGSCQNDRNRVFLQMTPAVARKLLAIVARNAGATVARAAAMAGSGDPGTWEIEIYSSEILCHTPGEPLPKRFNNVQLDIELWFPRSHLGEVVRALSRNGIETALKRRPKP